MGSGNLTFYGLKINKADYLKIFKQKKKKNHELDSIH